MELGDMHFWKDKSQVEKYKMMDVFTKQVQDLEDTKNNIFNEVDNLSSEKASITQEIDKKKSLNRKVIL